MHDDSVRTQEPEATTILGWAKEVLSIERDAITNALDRLDDRFFQAVRLILSCKGRVVLTGIGKSGHVAQKIASTLSSTGTPACFLHPSEAMHGDFGMLDIGDCLVALSYGGETREVVAVAKYAKGRGLSVIALLGNEKSSLASIADVVLNGGVDREADSLGLAPTSSSTVALALGDALAVALMRSKNFSRENFAFLHPGGRLGSSALLVKDIMHPTQILPKVEPRMGFHDILRAVTSPNFGIVAVVANRQLLGAISDGDLRRALLTHGGDALKLTGQQLMNSNPKEISAEVHAIDAISAMERYKITSLFVTVPESRELVGLVRLHDLIAAKVI